MIGQLADQPLPLVDPLERLCALRGQPVGHEAGRAIFGDRARPVERADEGSAMRSTEASGAR